MDLDNWFNSNIGYFYVAIMPLVFIGLGLCVWFLTGAYDQMEAMYMVLSCSGLAELNMTGVIITSGC